MLVGMYRSRTVSVVIALPWRVVYEFTANAGHLPLWAPGFARSIEQRGNEWIAQTTLGEAKVRFAPANDFGVLDHAVEIDGQHFHNPMRVIPNGDGAEVMFTAMQLPGVGDAQFAIDLDTIRSDLAALRDVLESGQTAASARPA